MCSKKGTANLSTIQRWGQLHPRPSPIFFLIYDFAAFHGERFLIQHHGPHNRRRKNNKNKFDHGYQKHLQVAAMQFSCQDAFANVYAEIFTCDSPKQCCSRAVFQTWYALRWIFFRHFFLKLFPMTWSPKMGHTGVTQSFCKCLSISREGASKTLWFSIFFARLQQNCTKHQGQKKNTTGPCRQCARGTVAYAWTNEAGMLDDGGSSSGLGTSTWTTGCTWRKKWPEDREATWNTHVRKTGQ